MTTDSKPKAPATDGFPTKCTGIRHFAQTVMRITGEKTLIEALQTVYVWKRLLGDVDESEQNGGQAWVKKGDRKAVFV